jgi:hypothetical protein
LKKKNIKSSFIFQIGNAAHYFSRFRVSLILFLLGAFLAFSSLGVSLGKQMPKPLGAHQ